MTPYEQGYYRTMKLAFAPMMMPMPRTPDEPGWYVDEQQSTHPLVRAAMSVPFGVAGTAFGGLAGGLMGGPIGALAGAGAGGLGGAALPWMADGSYMEEQQMDPEKVQAMLQGAGGSAAADMAAYLGRAPEDQQGFSRVVNRPDTEGATHVRHVPGGEKKAFHGPDNSMEPVPGDPQSVPGERTFSREDVQYQDSSPHPDQSCGRCRFYQGDGTCAIVMGSVNPHGWCNRFQEEQSPSVPY